MGIGEMLHNLVHQQIHFRLCLPARHTRRQLAQQHQPSLAAQWKAVSAGNNLLMHHQRNPKFRPHACLGALKNSRRDADDREWMLVNPQRAADDGRIPAEANLPEPVTNHHYWRASWLLVLYRKKATP